jgi:ribulose-5-phosphate 4-epimerase/fuculose-1-phosphate aldolase
MTATSTRQTEGAIRFRYRLTAARAADLLDARRFERLAAWRGILKKLALIGRDPNRYDGYAYGNLSVRDHAQPTRFFVTASQTGGAPRLIADHVVRIDACDVERFEVDATGAQPPSSESITHAMVYAADAGVDWIMHVHSPAIWRDALRLQLPTTAADVEYGSPAMAKAVDALAHHHMRRPLVFATLGHEDGVFACGATADETGAALLRALERARAGSS